LLHLLWPATAGNCENAPGQLKKNGVHGAPGPLVGAAGLPVLAVGYGVYWLVAELDSYYDNVDTVTTKEAEESPLTRSSG